jgi:hypothetical protein
MAADYQRHTNASTSGNGQLRYFFNTSRTASGLRNAMRAYGEVPHPCGVGEREPPQCDAGSDAASRLGAGTVGPARIIDHGTVGPVGIVD